MDRVKKIPYDSLSLAACVCEMQALVGGRLQRIVQPDDRTLYLGVYGQGQERYLVLSCSPLFARAHLATRMPSNPGEQPPLGAAMRRLVDGARVVGIRQIGFDRQLVIELGRAEGTFQLIAELTGKHANLVFIGPDKAVIAAAHFVSTSKSVRPILPGRTYEPPPFPPRKPVFEVQNEDELGDSEGASPFLLRLLRAGGDVTGNLQEVGRRVRECDFDPVAVPGLGAYAVSLHALELEEVRVATLSEALERHFLKLEQELALVSAKDRLLNPLKRVLLAREVALEDLRQAEETARRADEMQLRGELILAYAHSIQAGAKELETQDYEGNPLRIALDPEETPLQNAQRWFDRAKKAKARAEHVHGQKKRLEEDRIDLIGAIRRAEDAEDLGELASLEARARERRWLHEHRLPAKSAEEKPYEGHRIRERLGPGGVRVLYGENATSNDYLTLRVARPNDIWMHVRGATSAHVVIVTGNQPDRIGPEALRFAAQIAVQNSASKHSSYVPVDWTLKKHVRKPRGAKAGTATYSHEKTIHVERHSAE